MPVELAGVREFVAAQPAFNLLPKDELDALAALVTPVDLGRGEVLMRPGDPVTRVSMVRSGVLEARTGAGDLIAHLAEGDLAGAWSSMADGTALCQVTALEDTVLYQMPAELILRLRESHPEFDRLVDPQAGQRLRGVRDRMAPASRRLVGDLIRRPPELISPGASIGDAARRMRQAGVSCLPVVENGHLLGIVTDRDLRNRVLAADRDPAEPVASVMTPDPHRIEDTALIFQAEILMARHGINHLPVMRGTALAGVVTSTDMLRTHVRSVVFMAGDIAGRSDAAGVAEAVKPLRDMVHDLVEGGSSAYGIGHAVSAITDAATERLLQLAEHRLGPPPVAYLWMALGSQARNEQTACSDQDNALILSDDYEDAANGDYFKALAEFVCEGLDHAGYTLCPGDIMARNPRWRMPISGWSRTFARWVGEPLPEALMNASVFFDMRPVAGQSSLFHDLQQEVLKLTRSNGLFLGHLVRNALTHQPPLGFFRNFVLISGGEHHRSLDLKHSVLAPIVDLARVYALDAGSPLVNTHDRLIAAGETGKVSRDGARDLVDALDFLSLVRVRHQVRLLKAGKTPDNYLSPQELSPFERGHLKDAFAVVKLMQSAAVAAYRGGMA
ncbi:DUF294 nucleotidyltransferase-like domain-containing protein [Skermanella pratensis]|uniref:DUF294 nucleotidyltransferase-like domain-containing protein n=1 Tax=Skermanella pratensis TaxID=2233999 RepID=UPI001300D630|nr:DUF294 nucleotidyltransferase-like domain-containing protein [Skermanella pratensis]